MDPLTITCSIVALIGATNSVISICRNYTAGVKGADWELPRIIDEVESLRGVLQGLERLAKQAENADPAAVSQLPQLRRFCTPETGTFALCLSEIRELERKLILPRWSGESGSKRSKLVQAMGWPLKKASVKETLENIGRFKATLSLDLGTIAVEGISSVHNTASAIQKDTNDLNVSFHLMKMDNDVREVLHWLSELDPSVKYNKALEDRNAKTGKWLMDYEAFSKRKQTPASLLWLFGIPGCGKTILSSTVIEHILDRRKLEKTLMIAYFYIDFSEEETQIPENMIRSLLKQICLQSHSAAQRLDSLHSSCAKGLRQPTLDQLLAVSYEILNGITDGDTYFIIDALDECKQRDKLLRLLNRIHGQKHPKLHILVTSRPELDIEKSLKVMTNDGARICIQSTLVRKDILTYIQDRLKTDESLERLKFQPGIREEITRALMEKADGMFRWVACQLDSLKNCRNTTSLRKALKSLPKTLNNTYERILCGIDAESCEYARKILYWLTYSTRTLTLVEVAEIVAIDARGEPRFNPENRYFDPKEILEICPSLVSVFTERHSSVLTWPWATDSEVSCIKLAHFSVKEYLISVDIQKGPANMYAISRELADTSIAESCLALLLHFDKPDSLVSWLEEEHTLTSQSRRNGRVSPDYAREESLLLGFGRKFPLAQYAAAYWYIHAQKASPGNDFIGGLISGIFLNRDALENWIRLDEPGNAYHLPDLAKPSNDIGHALYYASGIGFVEPVKRLIGAGASTNAPCGIHGSALQAASYNGHQEIVCLLLAEGADINASGGKYGSALQSASHNEHQQIVQILLDAGGDVNTQGGQYGNNPLVAASRWGNQHIVGMLLDAGANVNAQGGRHGSALHTATYYGYQQVVEVLLAAGADINAQGRMYENALEAAVVEGHQQIVQILLDAGADVNAQGGEYGSALQAASFWGHQQVLKFLLDAGADVNAQGGRYGSALQAASYEGCQQIIEILLDTGADVNAQGGDYGDALYIASRWGHQQIVKMLLDAGADVNAPGGKYGSALQAASLWGHQQVLNFLLDAGADVNAHGGRHGSALQAALIGRQHEIAQILRDHGAHEEVQIQENDGDYEEGDELQGDSHNGKCDLIRTQRW